MSKKLFSKIFVLLLVVGLLFAVAPTGQAQAQTPTTLNVADWSEIAPVGLTGRPSVLFDGTTYHMWHGDGTVLYHSTSATADFEIPTTATATFVAGTPVIAELASVTVIKETDGFKMIAYGIDEQHFALYTSLDGTVWTHAGVVFDATGMNDMSKIDAPFVFNDGGVYKLYFQKKNAAGDKYEIYLVTSDSIGGTYTNPTLVLSPSANIADWDGKFVMHPTVVKDGGTYYMWYSAHNSVDAQRIGFATSPDGIAWTKSAGNPVIGPVGEPSVIKNGDTWQMWYLGSGSAVQYVSAAGPFEFQTIQAAIDAASDGDTITVEPGTYVEAIVINKPNLTIQSTAGADTTIIDANGAVMAVQLEDNLGTITFDGFSVTNFTEIGIAQSMYKPNTVFHVLNNKVVATGDFLRNGINVSGSDSTIIGNTVIGATYDNPSYGSSAILVVNASNVLIQNNNVSGTPEYGITINNWSNTTPMTGITVSGNTIDGADYGVLIWANDTFSIDGVTLTGNIITDYSAPVAVFGTVSNVSTLPPVANVTSGDYFYTIQEAINAATANDVINVAPGIYVEIGQIVIDKNLTIVGADKETTIIKPAQDTAGSGDARGWFLVNAGVEFNLSNVTLDGEGQAIYQAIRSNGTGTINNNIIKNMKYTSGSYMGYGVAMMGGNMTISNNTLSNIERIGIMAYGSGVTDGQITGNTYTGKGDGDWLDYGIEVGGGAVVTITGNTISNIGVSSSGWSSAAIQVTDAYPTGSPASVNITGNTLSNNYQGIAVGHGTSDGVIVVAEENDLSGTLYPIVTISDLVQLVDASPNWFGSDLGPQAPILGNVNVTPWCADAACETFAPVDNKITLTSADSQVGAIKIYVPGISYYLTPGTVLQNDSPCFEVYANDVMIYTDYPAAAACVPTNGSDGIWVADGVENLRVVNLEFDGTDQTTGSGIFFSGDAVGFQVVDNYFHDLDASGVVFTSTPSGSTMDIQGNMFQDLGAAAITVPTGLEPDLNAEFNSWGVYAGATLTDLDTEPHTHADFYMEYEGIIPLEKVAIGNTITYTVYGNLHNISGADFTLKFPTGYLDAGIPTNLSAFTAAGPEIEMFIVDETAGTIRFQGNASLAPITGENLPIFEVVFTGTAAGTGAISFDQTNDVFSMFPGYGPSTWVYAAGYVDRTVEVFVDSAAPTLTSWTPDEGDIYLAEDEDFVLTVDALDDNLFSLEIDHNVTTLPEFTVYAFASNVYGSLEAEAQYLEAGVTVTYDELTQTWVIIFDSAGSALAELLAKKDVTFYAVLHDQAGKTWGSMDPTEDFNTFAYSIVFDNTAPTLDSWTPAKDVTYMLTPSGDFVVTVDANDVNLYELEIDNSLEPGLPQFSVYADQTDPYGGDGALFDAAGLVVTFDPSTQTWVLTFENAGDALDAIIANQGITFYAVIHDLAGNTWGSMYTVTPDNTFAYTLYQQQPIARADSTGGAVVAVVSADGNTIDFTGEVDWYPADPDLGRTSGHRIGVRLSAPELDFGTADTTFTFNGQTYDWDLVKDGDDYVLVYPKVTAEIQTWEIVVTWGGDFSQTFTVNFNGTLGPVTAYTVDGEISMQGRVARNTEDVITLDGYMLDDFTADSLDKLGINYTLSNVLTGEYTIVTNQPRYLNITADLGKSITLISNRTLPTLWLRGGNAIWTDNEITLDDANQVGTDWGSVFDPDGNVNFDGIVNIQDLALVGGNYGLTSADAYEAWLQ